MLYPCMYPSMLMLLLFISPFGPRYTTYADYMHEIPNYSSIENFSPSDSKIFPEYIFPSLSLISRDPEELVRIGLNTDICPSGKLAN